MLNQMNIPVMYQGGSIDFGITPIVRRPMGAYDRSSHPEILRRTARRGGTLPGRT